MSVVSLLCLLSAFLSSRLNHREVRTGSIFLMQCSKSSARVKSLAIISASVLSTLYFFTYSCARSCPSFGIVFLIVSIHIFLSSISGKSASTM